MVVEPGNTYRFARALQNAGDAVAVMRYDNLSHATIVGVLGAPLRVRAPVLDDLSAFVHRVAQALHAGAASGQVSASGAAARSAASVR